MDASSIVKDITSTKFDASVDLAIRLGVDPKKAHQNIRGIETLPNGTGKNIKVLALVTPDKEKDAVDSGADYVGLDEYLQKIKFVGPDSGLDCSPGPELGLSTERGKLASQSVCVGGML